MVDPPLQPDLSVQHGLFLSWDSGISSWVLAHVLITKWQFFSGVHGQNLQPRLYPSMCIHRSPPEFLSSVNVLPERTLRALYIYSPWWRKGHLCWTWLLLLTYRQKLPVSRVTTHLEIVQTFISNHHRLVCGRRKLVSCNTYSAEIKFILNWWASL